MNKPHGILVFGANGSGKTTLGRELASVLHFRFMDHEDYHFVKAEPPYTVQRPYADCLRFMRSDMEKYGSFVLASVTGDFGEAISRFYELGVLVSAPVELRLKRIEQRAYGQHGERIRTGGDMYEQHIKFAEFVAARSLAPIEQRAQTLGCPVIRVDGTKDWRINAADIAAHYCELNGGGREFPQE